MKYGTIGAFKNVQNVPYCKASEDMAVGMGVIIDRVNKTVALPDDATECKSVVYIVSNINDKPEQHNSAETFVVKSGDFVRCDDLRTLNGMEIEFAASEINGGATTITSLAANDTLVFYTDGLVKKETTLTGYAVYFKVIEKTAYMGNGIRAEIVVQ